jgi:hypothetical protein
MTVTAMIVYGSLWLNKKMMQRENQNLKKKG